MKKDCIVWGAGFFGNKIMESVLLFGYKIIAYCDKNVQLSGKNVGEYPIISIEEAKELCRKSNGIDIIIAIKNKGAVQNVEEYVVSEFPKNTKVVYGEHIYDQIQERRLLKAYEKIKYTWTVSMANQFKQWIENINSELEYWLYEVADVNGNSHIYNTMCRNNELFGEKELFDILKAEDIVLDVGCGLVTYFGSKLPDGTKVQLIPVDALAHYYNRINAKIKDGLKEGYYCHFGMFEFLSKSFQENYADCIIIKNALDHCIDPFKSLVECFKVLKIGGCLYMKHTRAVAVYENWVGLHKWNIDCIDGDFVIWNQDNAVNISKELKEYAQIEVCYNEREPNRESQIVTVKIFKKKNLNPKFFFSEEKEEEGLIQCIDTLMKKMSEDSKWLEKQLETIQVDAENN